MNFDEWEPIYEAILADFGFPRRADEAARDELAALLSSSAFDRDRLVSIAGARVSIAGGASSLSAETGSIGERDVVIAASTAADVLRDAGIAVDLMTTDLDKNPETARTLTEQGVPVAVHAHGDNRRAVSEVVPDLESEHVLPTTQAAPVDEIENFGGFTDGDRGAFLADAFGASELKFVGWEFDDSAVGPIKRRKLAWAETLLYWLERRRDERFSVLDGRRAGIDTTGLPIR